MSKEEEYRDYALTMLDLAKRQPESAEKSRLMTLAEAWLDLAERAARSPIARIQRFVDRDTRPGGRPEAD